MNAEETDGHGGISTAPLKPYISHLTMLRARV